MPHGNQKDVKRSIAYKTGLVDWERKARQNHNRELGGDLQDRIQALLNSDKDLRGYGLNAEVTDGHVLLTGIVDALAEKERLTDLVKSIPGVKSVENSVTISTDGQVSDADVDTEVAQELGADPRLNTAKVYPKTTKGTVTLQGHAKDREQAELAGQAASKARGVKQIINRIRTTKPRPLSLAAIFHSQVKNDRE